MNRPDIPALTSLRIFAAMLVVTFHYNIGRNLSFPVGISSFGYEAVTFFFVLSGFILTYVHYEENKPDRINVGAVSFMVRRIARIAPAYFVGLALSAPFFAASFFIHHQLSKSTFITGLLLVPAALQAWTPSMATLWNIPAWSLSVELFLYLSFIPIAQVADRLSQIRFLIATYTFVCAFALTKLFLENNRPPNIDVSWWYNFLQYFPIWHLSQFLFGVALARLFIGGKRYSPAIHETILSTSIVIIGIIVFYHIEAPFLTSNAILAPIFGALIFGAAGASGSLSKVLSARIFVLLGESSYAIYIIHFPIWLFWYWITFKLKLKLWLPLDFFFYLSIVIGTSVLVYKLVENPARRLLIQHAITSQASDPHVKNG